MPSLLSFHRILISNYRYIYRCLRWICKLLEYVRRGERGSCPNASSRRRSYHILNITYVKVFGKHILPPDILLQYPGLCYQAANSTSSHALPGRRHLPGPSNTQERSWQPEGFVPPWCGDSAHRLRSALNLWTRTGFKWPLSDQKN